MSQETAIPTHLRADKPKSTDESALQAFGIIPVYPDNPLRRARAQQLLDDCQAEVLAASVAYDGFMRELEVANRLIVEAYGRASSQVPTIEKIHPFNLPGADIAIPIVRTLSMAGLGVVQLRYLAPAILNRLIATKVVTAQWAEAALVDLGLFAIRKGAVLSNALGLVVAAAAQIVIDVVVDSITGAIEKDRLVTAIREMVPMRASLRASRRRNEALLDALKRVNDVLKMLELAGLTPGSEQLEKIVLESLEPVRKVDEAQTLQSAAADLVALDHVRNAYRMDDLMDIPYDEKHIVSLERSAVLDVWDSKRELGARISVVTSRHGGQNQLWRFVLLDQSDKKQLLIESVLSGLVLDVAGGSAINGTPVTQWKRHEAANQQWLPVYGGEHGFFLVSRINGMVLSIGEYENLWGAPVEIRTATGHNQQLWRLN